VGLTDESVEVADNGTYGGRVLAGVRAPALIAEDFAFTL
jgi:hypothetical protein